jgi:hypothetical protein
MADDMTDKSTFFRTWKTNLAKAIAEELGRDWKDCGAYERQSYLDEAWKQIEARSTDDPCVND